MQQRNLTQRGIVGIAAVLFLGGGFATGVNHWVKKYDYVARVNHSPIRNVRLQRELIQMQQYLGKSPDELPWLEKSIVQQLVDRELQLQAAAEQGITANSEAIKEEWQRILTSQYGDDQARMNRALVGGRFTPSTFREELRKRNILKQFHDQLTKDVKVSEEDYEAYYLKNQDNYRVNERIQVRHILLHMTEERPEAKTKALAQELLQRAQAGEDFAELAKKYSDDTTSQEQGGLLEPFEKEQMEPAFEKASWSLKAGQLAPITVKTQYGYHIVRKEKHLPAGLKPLEEVKASFADRLLQQKQQEAIQNWITQARKKSDIRLHPRYTASTAPAALPSVLTPSVTTEEKPAQTETKTESSPTPIQSPS